MVENFTAHITPFGLDRNTFVYLPDDWQSSGRRYPVVYMFDGHNLFFDSTATYGTCWGLKEYMDAHPQAIIVAPECNHEGNARLPAPADAHGSRLVKCRTKLLCRTARAARPRS